MADETEIPAEIPHFETSDVEANLAMEQGLGVGARELAAQQDPGGVITPDEEDEEDEDDADEEEDPIERDTAVQGDPAI